MSDKTRPRGRPRKIYERFEDDPKREVLIAASNLFSDVGFKGTSMTMIAKSLGYRGPSLYHYFPDKLSMLSAIAGEMIVRANDQARTIAAEPTSAAVRLHRLLCIHVETLCSSAYNLRCIMEIPHLKYEGMAQFEQQIFEWGAIVRGIVKEGVNLGEFVQVDVELTYISIAGLVSSILRPTELRVGQEPLVVARHVADFVLRSLSARRDD